MAAVALVLFPDEQSRRRALRSGYLVVHDDGEVGEFHLRGAGAWGAYCHNAPVVGTLADGRGVQSPVLSSSVHEETLRRVQSERLSKLELDMLQK